MEQTLDAHNLSRDGLDAATAQSSLSRSSVLPSTFGLKDIFTSINILGGVLAVVFCIHGELRWAAYALLLGYIFGDSLDGLVARLTRTSNRFGAQFDQIGDHLTQCIAPAFIVYVAYRPLSAALAAILAAALVVSGSIRHARSAVLPTGIPHAYVGMPRTVSSLIAICFVNSTAAVHIPQWLWYGVPLILLLSAAHLLPIPFRTHKGRRLKPYVKYYIGAFFGMTLLALTFAPRYAFDVCLVWVVLYSVISWYELDPDERRDFFVQARRWAAQVRAAR